MNWNELKKIVDFSLRKLFMSKYQLNYRILFDYPIIRFQKNLFDYPNDMTFVFCTPTLKLFDMIALL